MQDYIMRLIQQVAQMLAAIMGHRNAGRMVEAQAEIERACLQTAGVPLSLIRQASPEALRGFLQAPSPERLARDFLLAELLMQEAEMNEEGGNEAEARHLRAHAFCLIHDSMEWLSADDAAHYHAKLDGLATGLRGTATDDYVSRKVESWLSRAARGLTGSTPPV